MRAPAGDRRIFSYEEALATFATVRELTADAVGRTEALFATLADRADAAAQEAGVQSAYERIVEEWAEAVRALGCEVKGIWIVDWDSGAGYFCWRWPEPTIGHFHGYDEGFSGRMPIN